MKHIGEIAIYRSNEGQFIVSTHVGSDTNIRAYDDLDASGESLEDALYALLERIQLEDFGNLAAIGEDEAKHRFEEYIK